MKKILIITYSFPPLNNIASRRFAELIPSLEADDYEIHILTTNSNGDLVVPLPEKNIKRIGSHTQSTLKVKNSEDSFITLIRRDLGFLCRSFDSSIKLTYHQLTNSALISYYRNLNIDLIIASFGPSASLWTGRLFSILLKKPWIADFRDLGALHIEESYKNPIMKRIDKLIEKKIIATTSAITTVSQALAEELQSNYKKPTYVIYNGWYINTNTKNDTLQFDSMIDSNTIYYAGRFYKHQLESLFILLNAIKSTNYKLVIRSLGPENLENELIAFSNSINCSNNLVILPPAKSSIIEIEQTHSLINLVIEDLCKKEKSKRGVLTGKFLRLLTEKPAILAIARDDSEIGVILNETQKGKLLTNPDDIALFINQIKCGENDMPNQVAIQKFSKNAQAKRLAEIISKTIHVNI